MNRDDIIRMARDAGYAWTEATALDFSRLNRFAALVAAAEREAIANLVEQMGIEGYGTLAIAVAIRARGRS
jgi:hypothetical protein